MTSSSHHLHTLPMATWRTNFSRKACALLVAFLSYLQLFVVPHAGAQTTAIKVGFIVDSNRPRSLIANTSIMLALSDFYRKHPNYITRIHIVERNSGGDLIAAAAAALDLILNEGVQAIIGPMTSAECDFVADIGSKAQVPIISISATSPAVSPVHSPFFIRAAGNDKNQVNAIAALVKAYGWRRVVTVFQDDEYSSAFLPYLIDALSDVGVQVPYKSALPAAASVDRILEELYRLETMQTRVFVLHTRFELAAEILRLAGEAGMMREGYVWILTTRLVGLLGWIDPSAATLQGVLGVEFYLRQTKELRNFEKRWAADFLQQHPTVDLSTVNLGNHGVWAHDAAWALAIAAERLGPATVISNSNINSTGSSELASLKASVTGAMFRDMILKTQFNGLGGRFQFEGGELKVTAVSIINVIGQGKKEIGYWIPGSGLVRNVKISRPTTYSTSKDNLRPVIWPGESMILPKGWEQPTNDLTLRIAIPGSINSMFWPFLRTETDSNTNRTTVTGFAVDVFEAAVRLLPYALLFEYIPAGNASYDDLTSSVANGTYDAVVADMTITANRSKKVDFTLPYKTSALSMVMMSENENSGKKWVFLKPLKTDLWFVSMVFFAVIGIVVWALERHENGDFGDGPVRRQIGTTFYFSFSTLVFAHQEAVKDNVSRFVVIVWLFTVLILQSNYTASLTSMLTVQQQRPKVESFEELLNSEGKIGYFHDSFMKNFLLSMNVSENRLVSFQTPESYQQALGNGTIIAIVDETPYLQLFLNLYCNKYSMVGPTNKTGGFGFAFSRGSPVVEDLSRAILNLIEGDELSETERKWFGESSSCASQDNTVSSNQLGLESFSVLFLMTGVTSLVCFLIHLATFMIQNQHSIRNIATTDPSVPAKLASVARLYDEKDTSSHHFRGPLLQLSAAPTFRRRNNVATSPAATANRQPSFSNRSSTSTMENTEPSTSGTSSSTSPLVNLTELASSSHAITISRSASLIREGN